MSPCFRPSIWLIRHWRRISSSGSSSQKMPEHRALLDLRAHEVAPGRRGRSPSCWAISDFPIAGPAVEAGSGSRAAASPASTNRRGLGLDRPAASPQSISLDGAAASPSGCRCPPIRWPRSGRPSRPRPSCGRRRARPRYLPSLSRPARPSRRSTTLTVAAIARSERADGIPAWSLPALSLSGRITTSRPRKCVSAGLVEIAPLAGAAGAGRGLDPDRPQAVAILLALDDVERPGAVVPLVQPIGDQRDAGHAAP